MEKNKALAKAMEFCARSEKSIKDTKLHLSSIGAQADQMDDIIDQLLNEGFIDERRYAQAFVTDKYRFNSWGRKKISHQLSGKGIPSNLIKEALDTLDPDEYYEHLKEQLEKKSGSIKGGSYYEKKAKLTRFAAGRGYEMDLIFDAIDELLKK
jgi:regulatory protein